MLAEWTVHDAARVLRMPTAADDKYSRGVVGVRTGSDAYPGAAVLGVEAAWRTGVGMVRYLGPAGARELVLQRRPETVTADGRVQAWVIGSGMDAATRPPAETDALRAVLAAGVPVVVDAGALDLALGAGSPLIVTPHAREFARLCAQIGVEVDLSADPIEAVARAAANLDRTVLLKGSRTLVAAPGGDVIAVEAGTAWLATAGTGDVLAGVIGALVASHAAAGALDADELAALAATGAWLHGAAARVASGQIGAEQIAGDPRWGAAAIEHGVGRPITALDVAEALPTVVGALLATR